ncbi:SpoIIE family protein phosphatase [bacterium]|nr:SpoIIE family protein phosphatase [bacterium]MBU1063831.1 SpoIIE family protein phosphatase [bacterium]MBU1633611.1 SpoIIE family protein phosphatase [bacterium]MBU1873634.1 SpoIIE family protein phosphatase [bacterium]
MLKNRSLRFKLSAFILTGTILVAAVLFSYYYSVSRKLILESALTNARHLTMETVNSVENVFRSTAKIPENLVYVFETGVTDEKALYRFMETVVKNNTELFGSAIAFEPGAMVPGVERFAPYFYKNNGQIVYSNLSDPAYNYHLQDWYQIPKELNKPVWSEPYFDEGGGDIIMATYSVPFRWPNDGVNENKFRGIITIDISLVWLKQVFEELSIYETGYGFLLSQSGKFLVHPDPDNVMNASIFDIAELQQDEKLRELGRKMVRGQTGFMNIIEPVTGQEVYLCFAPFPSSGYSMGIVIPTAELFAGLTRLNRNVAIIAVLGLLALFGVISLISGRITEPIRRLSGATTLIGQGDFNAVLPKIDTNDEIGQLMRSFETMQIALAEYIENLKKTTADKEKIEGELRIAHDIQMSIIPRTFPPFPDRSDVDIYGILESAKAVGGDLYDFFLLDENRLGAAIGDVSGKGVPASLFMAVTRTLLRAKSMNMKNASPGKIVTSMDIDLCTENDASMFVTFFYFILNLKTGELEYCNAGHNPPFVLDEDGEITAIDTVHGFPLGVMEAEPYETGKIKIRPGTRIVLYTDGVTEAENEARELFKEKRLLETLKLMKDVQDPKEITLAVKKAVKEFTLEAEQSDDLTMLVINYLGGNYTSK